MLTNLTLREKTTLGTGAAILLVFLLIQVFLIPAMDRRDALRNTAAAKQKALADMQTLKQEYLELKAREMIQSGIMSIQKRDFSLFSFLDDRAQKSGVKDNVAYMKPSVGKSGRPGVRLSSVKLKLDGLFLEELVDFLYRLETAPQGVTLKSLTLSQSGKESKLLEAVLEAQTLIEGDPS